MKRLHTLRSGTILTALLGLTTIAISAFNSADVPSVSTAPLTTHMALDDGEELYQTRCISCHQMNGQGIHGVFPPLDGSEWVNGDKGRLIRIILNGVSGEMAVNGVKYGGAMPPWNTFLSDEQIAALLTFVRTSWSNEGSEVSAAEVALVREATKDRKNPWTEEELKDESNMGIPGALNFGFSAPADTTQNR